MISQFIQALMKEMWPPFGCWLYYSETFLAATLGLSALIGGYFWFFLISLLYASYCFAGSINYRRRLAVRRSETWIPKSFDRLVFYIFEVGMAVLGIFIIGMAWTLSISFSDSMFWILLGIGLVVIGPAIGGIYTLFKGKWPDFP